MALTFNEKKRLEAIVSNRESILTNPVYGLVLKDTIPRVELKKKELRLKQPNDFSLQFLIANDWVQEIKKMKAGNDADKKLIQDALHLMQKMQRALDIEFRKMQKSRDITPILPKQAKAAKELKKEFKEEYKEIIKEKPKFKAKEAEVDQTLLINFLRKYKIENHGIEDLYRKIRKSHGGWKQWAKESSKRVAQIESIKKDFDTLKRSPDKGHLASFIKDVEKIRAEIQKEEKSFWTGDRHHKAKSALAELCDQILSDAASIKTPSKPR